MQDEHNHFLIRLNEAYDYLEKNISTQSQIHLNKPDTEKLSTVLGKLIILLLDRKSDYNDTLKLVYQTLDIVEHYDKIYVRDICNEALNLIANKITYYLPGFSDDRYRGNYVFNLVKRNGVLILLLK